MVAVKQRAKVFGLIITNCPECGNAMSFDRLTIKVCPYCGKEVHIDVDKVEVTLRSERGKKVRFHMN